MCLTLVGSVSSEMCAFLSDWIQTGITGIHLIFRAVAKPLRWQSLQFQNCVHFLWQGWILHQKQHIQLTKWIKIDGLNGFMAHFDLIYVFLFTGSNNPPSTIWNWSENKTIFVVLLFFHSATHFTWQFTQVGQPSASVPLCSLVGK